MGVGAFGVLAGGCPFGWWGDGFVVMALVLGFHTSLFSWARAGTLVQWRASSGVLAGARLACFWLVAWSGGWFAVGSLCASLILGIDDTSGI